MRNISVIIPSLNPDQRLLQVVEDVRRNGFGDIILVDDGSKDENKCYFPCGNDITLLVHEKNRGKGAALKTAIKYVIENRPDSLGVVTCDGDGQHLGKDMLSVCREMIDSGKFVLGVRDFSLPDVPPKSRIGNRLSTLAFAVCCGMVIKDTQTGLRAIPANLLKSMTEIEGDRFEYETNVLLALKSLNANLGQIKIETVYIDENKSTHFHPVKDTLRIFSLILKYVFSSFAAFLADIVIFSVLIDFFGRGVVASTVIARVFSSMLNFLLNKKVVFKSKEPILKAVLKYYLIAIPTMLVSAFCVQGVSVLLKLGEKSAIIVLMKIIIDILLFCANYLIQKKWIFKK